MSKIVLGKHDGRDVKLDLDALLRTRMLIQANSGKGKSWLLRRLAEQLFGKVQMLILDPEGEFATLREKFDYVLVGKGGETSAHPRIAALTAQRLLEIRASAVIDLYEMKPSERHSYVRLFLESLIDAPKTLWHPVVIILDEAHTFAPEKGSGESEASEAVISIATRGRKRGYCLIAATQRLGKFRKDAAAELNNVAIGGTFIDIDRKRAAESLGVYGADTHKFFDEIRLLERGSFYFLGPAVSDQRILVQVGSVETTHPEAGSSKHAAEPPPAPDKVKALLPKLADLPKEAEEKAKTVAELQGQVRSLNAELRAARSAAPAPAAADPAVTARTVKRAVDEATKPLLKQLELVKRTTRSAAEAIVKGVALLNVIANLEGQLVQVPPVPLPQTVRSAAPLSPAPRAPRAPRHGAESNGDMPKGERALLIAVAQHPDGAARDQLSVLTGYKRSSRDAYLNRLAGKGFITENSKCIVATQEGIDALGSDYEPLPTGDKLREFWIDRLPEGERKILQVLVEYSGDPIDRDSLDERVGYKRSSRDAYINRLCARRLVDVSGRGMVAASKGLFD